MVKTFGAFLFSFRRMAGINIFIGSKPIFILFLKLMPYTEQNYVNVQGTLIEQSNTFIVESLFNKYFLYREQTRVITKLAR